MILHLAVIDKFIPPFIDFVEENFHDFSERHVFFVRRNSKLYPIEDRPNIIRASGIGKYIKYVGLVRQMYQAEKIIIHGLWDKRVIRLLALQPWLLNKCYWLIWGGDLYKYQRNQGKPYKEILRKFVIKRLGHLVTYVDGDVELARKWYGAQGQHHECLMYTSNLYKEYAIPPKTDSATNILVGNSADSSNEHEEVFEKLRPYRGENIKIYVPLSYSGNRKYAKHVAMRGKEIFGDKFIALNDFMPYGEYLIFLGAIDIAVFNHRRQQAMGNTINLLGLGKKVYMRSDISSWATLKKYGISVFDIREFDLSPICKESAINNILTIKQSFTKDELVRQLHVIFKG